MENKQEKHDTRSKDATRGSWTPGLTTTSKKLLGTRGIATRIKDAASGSWRYY